MSNLSAGELNFNSSDELKAWLLTQPPELHGVIAARAALRVLPTLHRHSRRVGRWRFPAIDFRNLLGFAVARAASLYPSRAKDFCSYGGADFRGFSDITPYKPNANSAASCARGAAGPRNDGFEGPHRYGGEFLNCAGNAASAAEVAAGAAAEYANASAELWKSVSLDARRLGNVTPKAFASEELWPEVLAMGRDAWLENASRARKFAWEVGWAGFLPRSDKPCPIPLLDWSWPDKPHWNPWIDWYQRRLVGGEDPEEIELAFAMLPSPQPWKTLLRAKRIYRGRSRTADERPRKHLKVASGEPYEWVGRNGHL